MSVTFSESDVEVCTADADPAPLAEAPSTRRRATPPATARCARLRALVERHPRVESLTSGEAAAIADQDVLVALTVGP